MEKRVMQETTKQLIKNAGYDINTSNGFEIDVPEIEKLTRDMKKIILSTETPSKAEIRTLVNLFYQIQDIRIAVTEQIRAINRKVSSTGSNNDSNVIILSWTLKSISAIEKGIQDALGAICKNDEVGRWLLQITGIGNVLAAGCLAYFDINNVKYASNFISYAGLNDNNRPWLGKEKSKKIISDCIEEFGDGSGKITDDIVLHISARTQWKYEYLLEKAYDESKNKWSREKLEAACAKIPYNKDLKIHMWKIGKQFEYQKTRKSSVYGKVLAERIVYEIQRNESGGNAELTRKKLSEKNYSKGTETYKAYIQGKLPMAEINARSRRWVQKIFISHLFEEMYRVKFNDLPPKYYVFEHVEGHHDLIEPEVPFFRVPADDNEEIKAKIGN
jgi:ribosome recycling factor